MFLSKKLNISVIIPVYNGGASFRKCLLKLAEAIPAPLEIIVVADGDTDASWLVAKNFGARVIRIPRSSGPARARNVGARAAKGDILFFVDADVAISSDAIGHIQLAFQKEPDLAALIGSYDDDPGSRNFLSQYRNLLHHYVHQTGREEASTFWGACGAIRRDIFLKMGGFDDDYFRPSIEDIELGYRLKAAGYKIKLLKTLQVKHLKHWGPVSMLKADFFYRALPWTDLILRSKMFTNDLNLRVESRISVILTYAVVFFLLASLWQPSLLLLTLLLGLTLVAINAPLYYFFKRKHGTNFALKTIPWHWLYYLYSGLAFAIGIIHHYISDGKIAKLMLLSKS